MKTSPDEGTYSAMSTRTLVLPTQICRRRSLPRLPELHLNSDSLSSGANINESQNGVPPIYQTQDHMNDHYRERRSSHHANHTSHHSGSDPWEGQKLQHHTPHRPPRPSLQLQLKSPEFVDQFDAFLYKSQHIATPSCAPELLLEIPSEESSRRPSNCSGISSASPYVVNSQLPANFLFPAPPAPLSRRNSHAGNLGQTAQQHPVSPGPTQQAFLNVPRARSRGSSLPDTINSNELLRLRNFATSGKKVINKGDSYRSRASSINSSRSR